MKTHSDTDQVTIPLRPQATAGQDASKDETIGLLRRFYLGNPEVSHSEESVHGQYLPAFLSPYRDSLAIRHDYPLFLASLTDVPSPTNPWSLTKWPVAFSAEGLGVGLSDSQGADVPSERNHIDNFGDDIGIFPLPGLFKKLIADPPIEAGQQRLLEENLVRLEKHVIEIVDRGGETPRDAGTVLDQAALALQDSLRFGEKQQEQLKAGLKQLMERMPAGHFLPFSRRVPLHILAHMARLRFRSQYEKTLRQVERLTTGLSALLEMEKTKSIESIEPRMVLESIGPGGGRFLDPLALSNLMDHSQGSQGMSPERHERVREILEILRDEKTIGMEIPRLILIRDPAADGVCGFSGATLPPELAGEWEPRESSDPFATATALFQEQTVMLIRLARAMRIAALELENTYDAEIHDPWFADFQWQMLSEEEAGLAPVILVIDSASNVVRKGLASLSRLLRADWPLQVLLEVQPSSDPGADADQSISTDSRMELGQLGIGYRRTIVTQTSATRPLHLLEGFAMAFRRERPALHIVDAGYPKGETQPLSPWLMESAAVEGRAHPLFRYDPTLGGKWWIPLSLDGNPQPAFDWATYPFQYRTEDGAVTDIQMTFGFADYALLDPRWQRHFYPAPDNIPDIEEIIHIDQYLALERQQRNNRFPFIWAVYNDPRTRGTKLRRLIVSGTLILACLDRREFWRTLQAQAGVRNHHVETAVARLRAKAEDNAKKEQALLIAEHQAELAKVRQEAGADTLRRLTDTLLSMDFTSAPVMSAPATAPDAPSVSPPIPDTPIRKQDRKPQQPEAASPEPEPDPSPVADEPWIDTPLCTSCNECTDLNPKLFVYNDDKQAELGELTEGAQADLLQAAELCPAHCIYPGVSA
uniref:Ferredoxin n=1 Tax=Candidatus Kentrum sp. MB TaxID=2138164 RepID=A0A450X4C5_9GAMM|nr:MAG: Ferredoxin [Candidatus Kentron sp. MB]VFK30484.1 MAG: Ferredoxin [Candidatus Kentron sp. MB]VFK75270.1 MAG: Ferredoxin [Candidatus Kentron sp. MB]